MFSQFLPADSLGLDRGQSAAATTFLGRTISHLLFFEVLPVDSPVQTAYNPAFPSGQSAPSLQTVWACVVFLTLRCFVEGLARLLVEGSTVSVGHHHRHPPT